MTLTLDKQKGSFGLNNKTEINSYIKSDIV